MCWTFLPLEGPSMAFPQRCPQNWTPQGLVCFCLPWPRWGSSPPMVIFQFLCRFLSSTGLVTPQNSVLSSSSVAGLFQGLVNISFSFSFPFVLPPFLYHLHTSNLLTFNFYSFYFVKMIFFWKTLVRLGKATRLSGFSSDFVKFVLYDHHILLIVDRIMTIQRYVCPNSWNLWICYLT